MERKLFNQTTWTPEFAWIPTYCSDTGLWVWGEWTWRKYQWNSRMGCLTWDYRDRIPPYWSHEKDGFVFHTNGEMHMKIVRRA